MRTVLLLLAASLALARSATVAPPDERPPPPGPGDWEQTEITFQNIPFRDIPGDHIEQKLVEDLRPDTFLPLLVHGEPQEGLTQEEVPPFLSPRGRKPTCTRGSDCTRPAPRYRLDQFPPARPTPDNIGNICSEGRQKVVYGPWNLPQTGFSHLSRQGDALNKFEEGAGQCCQRGPDERLPCCQDLWSEVLGRFCASEFAVKTRPHRCCRLTDDARQVCFQREAPFPDYLSPAKDTKTEAVCVDPLQCPWMKFELQVGFPPAEPKEGNLKEICQLGKVRLAYMKARLPRSMPGSHWNQAQAITQLEKGFRKCCKKRDLDCAHQRWEQTLDEFCEAESGVKTRPHACCKKAAGEARYGCFAQEAPFGSYDREVRAVSLEEVTPTLLDALCAESVLLTRQRNIPALIQNITDSCCKLQANERSQCAGEQKAQFIAALCTDQAKSWKDPKKCCALTEGDARDSCFGKNYLRNISLASAA